jgi:23S rRNA (uracil1939-C5)-methyltransferase
MSQKIIITSLTSEGEGIGSSQGLKVFVEGALPGEEVEIEIVEKKKNYAKAKKLSLIKPSQSRITPPCSLFGECGGCQIMHLAYSEQLKEKKKRVSEALFRIGGLQVEVNECRASPTPFNYRNKIQLPLVWDMGRMKAGLYRKNTHEIIPIDECQIQSQAGNQLLQKILPHLTSKSLRTLLIRTGMNTNEALIVLVSDGTDSLEEIGVKLMQISPEVKGVVENINPTSRNVILSDQWKVLAGRPYIYEKLGEKRFKISASAFFQVNSGQATALFQEAIRVADIQKNDTVLDAFCGVGTLALFASDYASEVIGTECVKAAIEDAKENAKLNGATNCTFKVGRAEDNTTVADIIFLNPPRKGCEEKLLHFIGTKRVKKVIYISCDPATLARDLKILSSYGYKIEVVQPFDMFPQTMHVETLVLMKI